MSDVKWTSTDKAKIFRGDDERLDTASMPKSPNTSKAHCIPHQWEVKRFKNPTKSKSKCAVCTNFVGFLSWYEKCKSCKQSVHLECKARVNDNCGLTPKHFKELLTQLVITARQDHWASPNMGTSKSMNDMPAMNVIELPTTIAQDSSSSANSSAPTTPGAYFTGRNTGYLPNVNVIPPPPERLPPYTANICVTSSGDAQFAFPEPLGSNNNIPHIVLPPSANDEQPSNVMSQGFECTLRPYVSDDGSEKNESFNESQENGHNGYTNSDQTHKWDRRSWNMFTIRGHGATSWREVTIPFEEIRMNSLIGRGRFGEVHKVDHFGTVAIKILNMNHVEEDKRIEAFKQDTACFQNARHENLVFFVGYTMDRDRLGIVMEYINGQTLFQLVHDDDFADKRLDFNDVLDFAKQICQGMSYLHTKRILHKDLRSKNLFIKDRRVVITDYGVFNVKKLSYPARHSSFVIPKYWLCYLAPELMKALKPSLDPLPFSERSDVFAFGTIWFELMTREFPFTCSHPDMVMWQVGNGMKSSLVNVNVCREAKILLMECWAYAATDRCSFADILQALSVIPKKPARRSPSCKSFESIF